MLDSDTGLVPAGRVTVRKPWRGSGARSPLVEPGRTELLVRLLARHQEALYRYIFALLPHEEDARDVLQETSVALLRKFDEYDAAQPFLAWAYGFAYREVLKQRDRNQRGLRHHLNRGLIERLAREREEREPLLQERLQALEDCLKQLPPGDQELIRRRYEGRISPDEMASQRGTSRRTVFRELDRIRRTLLECVNRRLAATDLS
jgi:RNA polymerase sigma-70 factor (ECF subfamily)